MPASVFSEPQSLCKMDNNANMKRCTEKHKGLSCESGAGIFLTMRRGPCGVMISLSIPSGPPGSHSRGASGCSFSWALLGSHPFPTDCACLREETPAGGLGPDAVLLCSGCCAVLCALGQRKGQLRTASVCVHCVCAFVPHHAPALCLSGAECCTVTLMEMLMV